MAATAFIGGSDSSATAAFGATEGSAFGAEAPLLLEETAPLLGATPDGPDGASVLLDVAPFSSGVGADCFAVDEGPSPDDASLGTASVLAEEASALIDAASDSPLLEVASSLLAEPSASVFVDEDDTSALLVADASVLLVDASPFRDEASRLLWEGSDLVPLLDGTAASLADFKSVAVSDRPSFGTAEGFFGGDLSTDLVVVCLSPQTVTVAHWLKA